MANIGTFISVVYIPYDMYGLHIHSIYPVWRAFSYKACWGINNRSEEKLEKAERKYNQG